MATASVAVTCILLTGLTTFLANDLYKAAGPAVFSLYWKLLHLLHPASGKAKYFLWCLLCTLVGCAYFWILVGLVMLTGFAFKSVPCLGEPTSVAAPSAMTLSIAAASAVPVQATVWLEWDKGVDLSWHWSWIRRKTTTATIWIRSRTCQRIRKSPSIILQSPKNILRLHISANNEHVCR